ncbi:uncharacterized protein [Epargyreus clarus]|uniref:uncharacterized protein isoform X1 n=1 Tax=Epargyreus clarus TaxID=520877 RepID=UPI003C306D77
MSKHDDSLFLLEVLIDKIVFVKSPCFSDKDFRTCVNIECPAVQPLEICDDDTGACIAKSGGPFVKTFNNGKSCLFSLKEDEISSAMSKFPIKISVYKSLPCGCLPTKIVMGEATIDMTKEFVQARNKFLEDPLNVSYQALKDSFRIVGPDGAETGEIVMFLRISCFGKLIITRFQGTGGTPNLGGSGSNAMVDRSCAPKRDFQTSQDPCACGAARSGSARGGVGRGGPASKCGNQTCVSGGGTCHSARDPYNSMPCEDPDDPCFCSGPMQPGKQSMACRNTDQYCLHIPKGAPPSVLIWQELTEERKNEIKSSCDEQKLHGMNEFIAPCINGRNIAYSQCKTNAVSIECLQLQDKFQYASSTSIYTTTFTRSPSTSTIRLCRSHNSICSTHDFQTGIFGTRTTEVYMNLFNDFCHSRASGTQATALINKCLQVNSEMSSRCNASTVNMNSNYDSICTMSTLPSPQCNRQALNNTRYQEVYFFGRKKKDSPKPEGMGCTDSNTKIHRTAHSSSAPTRSDKGGCKMKSSCSSCVQTRNTKGASTATSTVKAVSIKEDNPKNYPCPALGPSKGEMTATVSHIRIGPKEPCPVHGKDPCQGPKCIIASSGEQQAPVKVTTVTNPRRGVFELVIRKMTGAPLARNELMLEWTPPPSRPPPCGGPCPIPCAIPTPYRPSKCKMIICRPATCRPKCCKKPCKVSPCRISCRIPCRLPCKKCCKPSCCGKPPCGPPPTCSIPCALPCCRVPCSSPCKSSPCLRPCPVGRKRPRKTRSQPKIKMNRKGTSPCLNRSKTCPVVRCRSMPAPCIGCCLIASCPPRKCCSVAPCKPPKCCKSSCSVCCI